MMFPSASLPSMASILAASPSFTASSAFQVQQRAPTKASGIRAGSFLGSRKGLVAAPCLALASRPQHGAAVTASAESDAFKLNRRDAISGAASAAAVALGSGFLPAMAYEDDDIRIITQEMEKQLEDIPMVTLPSGLQYKELKPGRGPTPPKGFQVTVNYVAMIAADPKSKKPGPRVIDSSIEKRKPYDIRLGTGSVRADAHTCARHAAPAGFLAWMRRLSPC
mmetsp:Transcript_1829/g.6557  ORF Transcript_1829/g.6557 Transcript_1829/m.6557 type:complete len:223 (+) Transcript_1829:48-716(+)